MQAITLIWVGVMLAIIEDVPMVCLTTPYVLRIEKVPTLMQVQMHPSMNTPNACLFLLMHAHLQLISMLMSAGAIYLKCGKLLVLKACACPYSC